jgi:hypothetical protein
MLMESAFLMDEWDNTFPFNLLPFSAKGETLCCSGHLN